MTEKGTIMSVKVGKNHLQENLWTRDKGDALYSGKLDQVKVDKDEGYEVLYFIQKFLDEHKLSNVESALRVEYLIHQSSEIMRDKLKKFVYENWNNSNI
jgi:cell division protein YceG involved in septum cleavage